MHNMEQSDTSPIDFSGITPVTSPTSGERPEARLEDIWGYLPRVTAIPTWNPRRFYESIALDEASNTIYYYDFTNAQWREVPGAINESRFGGTATDGALSVTSGTTTVSIGSAVVLVKNYTTISISNGATLDFSNPASAGSIVILRATGDVTIAGTIDLRGMGAIFGAGGGVPGQDAAGAGSNGSDGTNPSLQLDSTNMRGSGGTGGLQNATTTVAGGNAGSVPSNRVFYTFTSTDDTAKIQSGRGIFLIPGAGGAGGGGGGDNNSGDVANRAGTGASGGRGGGALLIECAGTLTFTGTINVSGQSGSEGGQPSAPDSPTNPGLYGCGGGGGGGSAGMAVLIANTVASESGTISAAGGNGGDGGDSTLGSDSLSGDPGGGGGGGGAASLLAAGGAGGTGAAKDTNGGAGSNAAGQGAGGGGGGGAGCRRTASRTGGTGGTGGTSYGGLVITNGIR